MEYGPRTAEVLECIRQVESLDAQQITALAEVGHTIFDHSRSGELIDAYYSAISDDAVLEAAISAADPRMEATALAGAWATVNAELRERGQSVAVEAISFEIIKEAVSAEHYQLMVAALELALELPLWWSELGARNLFLEMLTEGVSFPDARQALSALI